MMVEQLPQKRRDKMVDKTDIATGLLRQRIEEVGHKYQKKAMKMVEHGNLWNDTATVLYDKPGINMWKSWQESYMLKIFNWFPHIFINDFKPKCNSCGMSGSMKRDGLNNPPRLVFGEHKNYIMNAPHVKHQ
jgi:hypothetical protein